MARMQNDSQENTRMDTKSIGKTKWKKNMTIAQINVTVYHLLQWGI